jgi:hypothetical protein
MTVWFFCPWCRRIEGYAPWVDDVKHRHGGGTYLLYAYRTRALARAASKPKATA